MATTETITAHGHEHVQATHESTVEFTSDDWLTPAGDCILGVEADQVPADFDPAVVDAAQSADAEITVTIEAGDHSQTIAGRGHPELTFDDDRSMVVRSSTYTDDRTVMIDADAAAADIDRGLVAALADGATATVEFRVR
ncbi:DUF371 domain-containing protein [Halonotius pteroides]|uniref:DUF371 domain-containing protein n=1 Tax=Halonotius pteroides TaxID=268735 RepID=A0A3A6QLK9_9EURY|nr:DUF371 domain-containing protein [Halonotius pteroides]RJX48416.1 DUF371 domain-containing protein [Halonotius pteroides]